MQLDLNNILLELSYKTSEGIIDLQNESHANMLTQLLNEMGVENAFQITQKAKVYFSYLAEVSTKKEAKKPDINKVLSQTFQNPETGNMVRVASALGYDKTSKAYSIAKGMFNKAGYSEKDIDMVDTKPGDEEQPLNKKSATKSTQKPSAKPVTITTTDAEKKQAQKSKSSFVLSTAVAKSKAKEVGNIVDRNFSPELKKYKQKIVSSFEKMVTGQKLSKDEQSTLQKFFAFKNKSGEATLYIANQTPGDFKKHKKISFGASNMDSLKSLSDKLGLQSVRAQEGALGKKEVTANKISKSRKTIEIKKQSDGSIIMEGVAHKKVPIPDEKSLTQELKKRGYENAQDEAKTAISALKRYNKQLEMMSSASNFEVVDFGDTSTPDGRQKTFDNVKTSSINKFSELFQRDGASITPEQKSILDKFSKIKFNQNGSNPKFEEELDSVFGEMTKNKDFRTAVPDLLEVFVFSKMLGRGYHAFLPSSETFKVSDVIAFKKPDFTLPKTGNAAKSIADNLKMIKTSMVLVGGQSVKFEEGGAGQSDSKVEQTEYKNKETKGVLQNLLSTYQFVYSKNKDKYPPSSGDIGKREKEIMNKIQWAIKSGIISKQEYERIMEEADKQADNNFNTAMKNGVGPLSKDEKANYKRLLRLHTLSGAAIETINNNDTDFNYFSNERSRVNEKTGEVKNEELDGVIKKCCMSWSYNPGFGFSMTGGKKWMTPGNVNPSHIVRCDKKKK